VTTKIYLDVCALSRPLDDQNYARIRLDTEAVNLILSKVRAGNYRLLVSPVHLKEIEAIPDMIERIELRTLLMELGESTEGDRSKIRKRAEDLVLLGFGIADSAHVASAEYHQADFISCDKKLLKKCGIHKMGIWRGSPVLFCEKEGLI
jgi:predicted nucleic acid-binding protein